MGAANNFCCSLDNEPTIKYVVFWMLNKQWKKMQQNKGERKWQDW